MADGSVQQTSLKGLMTALNDTAATRPNKTPTITTAPVVLNMP
jgi:hypothetical protein